MNVLRKRKGSVNVIRKKITKARRRTDKELSFGLSRLPRDVLRRLLIICGKVPKNDAAIYEKRAKELDCDFVIENRRSSVFTKKTLLKHYDENQHDSILLIGDQKQLPGTPFGHKDDYAWTDFFIQDANNDDIPDTPVGRVYGTPDVVLFHMDPPIIDSNIAIVFDSQPGRSTRHIDSLAQLGFDVEVLKKYTNSDKRLMEVSEFILQFSDGVFTRRIHGSPERWASHNSVILSYEQAQEIRFEGYPVVFAEACSTARDGPLIQAFLQQGVCYIGSTLDTINNSKPYDDWRDCCYADGWKFGFLDFLDSYDFIGQVKINVEKELWARLDRKVIREIEMVRTGEKSVVDTYEALTMLEWVLIGNPMRTTTVGPNANFTPGRIVVDT